MRNQLKQLSAFFILSFFASTCAPEKEDAEPQTPEQYFTYSLDGIAGLISSPKDSLGASRLGDTTVLYGSSQDGTVRLYARFDTSTTGTHPFAHMSIFRNGRYHVSDSLPVQTTANAYENAGGYVLGTYSGNLKDSIGTQRYTVSGVFKLKRVN